MNEANPNVRGHLAVFCTGGGEVTHLDIAAQAISSCKKPKYAAIDSKCLSAGYWLACGFDKIYATSPNDSVGSIGAMISFLDTEPMLEKMGIVSHVINASQSTEKNKQYEELCKGEYDSYRADVLDPLCEQFIQLVKKNRPKLNDPEGKMLKGATCMASKAVQMGLIDGIMSMGEIVQQLNMMIVKPEFNF